MRPDQSKHFHFQEKNTRSGGLFASNRGLRNGSSYGPPPEINLGIILKHLFLGLQKLFIALKYQFFKSAGNVPANQFKLPWIKIGLAALAIFILTKKDLQFSINMKAPLGGFNTERGAAMEDVPHTDQMSLAQAISHRETTTVPEGVVAVENLDIERVRAYVDRFTKVARAEMQKFGIPASLLMAQAILESEAGAHPAARKENNHFGKPLAGNKYDSAWANWRAHSILLQEKHGDLVRSAAGYKKWARALSKAGYNKDKYYEEKLITTVERFQLFLLDDRN